MKRLISSLQITTKSHFSLVLFKAMYLVAFQCFLRIGEFTYTKGRNGHLLTEHCSIFENRLSGSIRI